MTGKPSARLELVPSMVIGWKGKYAKFLGVGRVNADGAGFSGSWVAKVWLDGPAGLGDREVDGVVGVPQTMEENKPKVRCAGPSFSTSLSLSLRGGGGGSE
jgi:hypothetical protein